MSIADEINGFVEPILTSYTRVQQSFDKVVRDGLGGLYTFDPYEISVIDSPFVQRLRYIHQTALTYLVYPSANHTRFEHSLGVADTVKLVCRALKDNPITSASIDDTTFRELRLAALLHDIGHGPFSHATETVIKTIPSVKEELRKEHFSSDKPHEMISYYITDSECFKKFLSETMDFYELSEIDTDKIPKIIIGVLDDPDEEGYIGDLINGPFDVDKLDYILRDAHFTGIKMSYDLERFLNTISIDMREGEQKRIINTFNGAHILEQLLFCKMFLFPSVYHHHKVRACECMLKSIFEIISDKDLDINGKKFDRVTDFLSFNDHSFLFETLKNASLKIYVNNLLNRNLLMRCLVINRYTIDQDTLSEFPQLVDLRNEESDQAIEIITRIRQNICDKLKSKGIDLEYYDVWLDLPEFPRFNEPFRHYIKMTNIIYQSLSELFPASQWAISFAQFKWKGHVFGPLKYQKEIAEVGKKVLEDEIGIRFSPSAEILAKHRSPE